MPSLTRVTPPRDSFKYTEDWDISSGCVIPLSLTDVGKLEKCNVILHNPHAHVRNKNDWVLLASMIIELRVDNSCCNDPDFTELKMDVCAALKLLVIDEKSLQYVNNLVIRGLSQLEEVSIGSKCFTETEGGRFEVSDCNALKRVSIGDECCSEWSEFVLKNCSVEEVSIGDGCFVYFQNTVFEGE